MGEDLGGGSPDFKLQEPLSQELGQRRYLETWYPYSTRRPRLGGGLRKAAPWYRRASLLGPQAALEAVLGGILGGLRGVFWAVLGGLGLSWAVLLGWFWRISGGPGAVLGGFWASLGGVLRGSWAVLEASWGATWGRLGASWGLLEASWGLLEISWCLFYLDGIM